MRRALVTGASGFIGPHLVERLQQNGYEVRCLVRPSSDLERLKPLSPEFVFGDVTDQDSLKAAVEGVDTVFHLAGVIKALGYDAFHRVNVEGTGNLAAACAKCDPPPTLILVSSQAAAGTSPPEHRRCESDPVAPVSMYGRSKLAGERAAAAMADRVPLTIIRPGIVIGDGDPLTLQMYRPINKCLLHLRPTLSNYRYSFVHVEDLVELLINAAERGERVDPSSAESREISGRYFAADDHQPTYVELGHIIGSALGKKRVFSIPVPKPISWVIVSVQEIIARVRGRPSIVNLDKVREGSAGDWTCSSEAAKRDLDFRTPISLVERFNRTARWYREAGWL